MTSLSITNKNSICINFNSQVLELPVYKEEKSGREILWFKGKEMAEFLGYKDPNDTIRKHINEKYKITFEELIKRVGGDSPPTPNIPYHEGKVIYITEAGLNRLIMDSKLPKAIEFQEYILEEVIPSIRKQHTTKAIEAANQESIKKAKEDRERLLIEKFDNRPVFYLADIGENLIKYGYSDNIKQRVAAHKRVFPSFYLHDLIETTSNRELERRFESHDYISSRRIKQEFAGANQTELIGDSSLEKIYEIALKLRENLSGENDRFRHEEAMKDKEIELKRIELEMAKLKVSPITTHENKPLSSHTVKELKEICYKHGIIPPKKKTDIIIELYKILSSHPQKLDHILDIDYLPQPKSTKENLENEKGKKIDDETEELYGFLDTIIEYKIGEKLNRTSLMSKIQEKYPGKYNDSNSQGKFYSNIFPSYLRLRYSDKNIDFESKKIRDKDKIIWGWNDFQIIA